jgi:hypothetical protein
MRPRSVCSVSYATCIDPSGLIEHHPLHGGTGRFEVPVTGTRKLARKRPEQVFDLGVIAFQPIQKGPGFQRPVERILLTAARRSSQLKWAIKGVRLVALTLNLAVARPISAGLRAVSGQLRQVPVVLCLEHVGVDFH